MYFGGYEGLRPFIPLAQALSYLDPLVNAVLSLTFEAASVATRIGNFCSSYFSSRQEPRQGVMRWTVTLNGSEDDSNREQLQRLVQTIFSQVHSNPQAGSWVIKCQESEMCRLVASELDSGFTVEAQPDGFKIIHKVDTIIANGLAGQIFLCVERRT